MGKIVVDTSNNKWFSADPGVLISYNDREFKCYSIYSYDDDLNPWCLLSIPFMIADNNNGVYILAKGEYYMTACSVIFTITMENQ